MNRDEESENDDLVDLIKELCFGATNPMISDGLDRETLKPQFQRAKECNFREVEPIWDLRSSSIRFNNVATEALEGATLYIAERESFLVHCIDPDPTCLASLRDRANQDSLLRIVDHWLRGAPLTPPLFFLDSSKHLIKVDGYHRMTVALSSPTPRIPFYSRDEILIDGIRIADEREKSKRSWRPD